MKITGTIVVSLSCIVLTVAAARGEWPLPDEKDISSPMNGRGPRIVGGEIATTNYRKGTALVYYKDWWGLYGLCTGSIIGRKWILSAAHCYEDYEGKPWAGETYGVIPASWFASVNNVGERGIDVKNVYVHKDYNGGNMTYDIAVLELEEEIPLEYYNKVEIVDVPEDMTKVKAVGYGALDDWGERAKYCMMADVTYRDFDWCYEYAWYQDGLSSTSQLCAVGLNWPTPTTE